MFPAVMFPLSPVGAVMFPLFREIFSSLYAHALRRYVSARYIFGPNIFFSLKITYLFFFSGTTGKNESYNLKPDTCA